MGISGVEIGFIKNAGWQPDKPAHSDVRRCFSLESEPICIGPGCKARNQSGTGNAGTTKIPGRKRGFRDLLLNSRCPANADHLSDALAGCGRNSLVDLDRLEASSLLSQWLIALTPQQLQPASFYDRLHKRGILCAIGTYGMGQLDEQPLPEAATRYRSVFRQGGDILTTDRPREVSALF